MEQIPTEVMDKIEAKYPGKIKKAGWHGVLVREQRIAAEYGYRLGCEGKEKQLLSANAQNFQQSESIQLLHKKLEGKEKEIAELKAENEGNKEIARVRGEAINELQNEAERLKGLMFEAYNSGYCGIPVEEFVKLNNL